MNLNKVSANILRKSVLLLLLIPAFAWGQHKASAPAPHASAPSHASAPAQHASAPSHASTPSRTNTQSHPAASGHATAPNNMGRSGATAGRTGNTAGRTGTTGHAATGATAGRTGNTGHAGATAGRTGNNAHAGATAGRTGNNAHAGATAGRTGAAGARGNTHAAVNRTPPGKSVALKGGGHASVRPNGQIRSVDKNGMHIEHGFHGGRTVVSTHNGARIVTTGRHGGYVQRAYVTRGGHSYYSRTYVVGGHAYVRAYRGYYWGGRPYYGYYPGFYYHPGFYGWAYNPWPAPIVWGIGAWGWGAAPWYGYYGGFFAPYPSYPSAAFWLTDYLLAANLQAAYAARAEANADAAANAAAQDDAASGGGGDPAPAPASGAVVLTPEVKAAIAAEVKAQLAAAQAAAAQPAAPAGDQQASAAPAASNGEPPAALDPAHTTFVVSSDLDVMADGQECGLSSGDVLTRIDDTPDADQKVTVLISASKKGDCGAGSKALVAVDDLQEMHNKFAEQIDDGMKALAAKQGSGGMPKAPDTGTQASDVPPPQPDASAAKALDDQSAAADQTEQQVKQEAAGGGN